MSPTMVAISPRGKQFFLEYPSDCISVPLHWTSDLQQITFAQRGGLGRMLLVVIAAVLSLLVVSGLAVFRPWQNASPDSASGALLVYCAAGLRGPLEEIRAQYEVETGVQINVQYAGSQSLIASLAISRTGDLFISADEQYIDTARSDKLLGESFVIAQQHPVLAVRRGNPNGIRSLADLLTSDVRIGLANPDLAAIGKVTQEIFERSNQWDILRQRITVVKTTVNEVANDLKVGAIDAAFVWDQTVWHYSQDIETVHLAEFEGCWSLVSVGLLTFTKQPEPAVQFAKYLASPKHGQAVFQRHGFSSPAVQQQGDREGEP